ncbi:MAG TPA: hypothetical protein VHB73_00100, partial [Alphaproteobacteria bacterium]|nr:hypothetical protein [Alphaproteobacteria bacterium]
LAGWLGFRDNSWLSIGSALALPVLLAAFGLAGWSLWEAGRNGKDYRHALGLAMVGVAAALMLGRIVLNARLGNYGFFMMPLAVWLVIHVLVAESARFTGATGESRRRWLAPICFTALTLFAVGTIGQFELTVYAAKTFAVGEGRDRFFTFQPYAEKSGDLKRINGPMLKMMIDYMHQAPKVKTLAVLPGGIAANYHLRLRTPLRELDFNPMVLAFAGEGNIIQELRKNPPDRVLLDAWDYSDYNEKFFGADERTGRGILFWLSDHYDITDYFGQSEFSLSRHLIDFTAPKNEPGK